MMSLGKPRQRGPQRPSPNRWPAGPRVGERQVACGPEWRGSGRCGPRGLGLRCGLPLAARSAAARLRSSVSCFHFLTLKQMPGRLGARCCPSSPANAFFLYGVPSAVCRTGSVLREHLLIGFPCYDLNTASWVQLSLLKVHSSRAELGLSQHLAEPSCDASCNAFICRQRPRRNLPAASSQSLHTSSIAVLQPGKACGPMRRCLEDSLAFNCIGR